MGQLFSRTTQVTVSIDHGFKRDILTRNTPEREDVYSILFKNMQLNV